MTIGCDRARGTARTFERDDVGAGRDAPARAGGSTTTATPAGRSRTRRGHRPTRPRARALIARSRGGERAVRVDGGTRECRTRTRGSPLDRGPDVVERHRAGLDEAERGPRLAPDQRPGTPAGRPRGTGGRGDPPRGRRPAARGASAAWRLGRRAPDRAGRVERGGRSRRGRRLTGRGSRGSTRQLRPPSSRDRSVAASTAARNAARTPCSSRTCSPAAVVPPGDVTAARSASGPSVPSPSSVAEPRIV